MSERGVPRPAAPWWLRLSGYARGHGLGMSFILLLMCADAAFTAIRPWPVKLLVDYVLAGTPLPKAAAWIAVLTGTTSSSTTSRALLTGWLALLTVLLVIAGQAVTMWIAYVSSGLGIRMTRALGADLFDHAQRLSFRFHSRWAVGDLVRRVMNDSGCVRILVMEVIVARLDSLVRLGILFFVMWKLDQSLAVIVLLTALPLGVISRLLNRPMMERAYEEMRLGGEMSALAEQTLTVLPVVQGFSREKYGDERFVSLSKQTLRATLRLTFSQLQFQSGTGAVRATCTAALMIAGGFHVLQGSLSVGSLLVFLSYLASIFDPIEDIAYASFGVATAAAGARRVFEVLDSGERVEEVPDAPLLSLSEEGSGAHVRFEDVGFGYEPGRPVLRGVSIEARRGELVALVGATGAGKSTLMSLVPRFFDPWSGRVTIDGTDVRQVQLKSLRNQIALVLQEPFLLPLSVADNIAYGRPEATRGEIEAAAVAANANVFIERLPQGYDTVIGERGATLSGGERQRLAIARAFLKDAPILLLDEPTSALDGATEGMVLTALERLVEGRTVLVIAHRLSTVRRANRIVVLHDGMIAETGTHNELIANGGKYVEIYPMEHDEAPASMAC